MCTESTDDEFDDREFKINDGDNYELISLDLPIDIYDKLVKLAGSEDEIAMSKVVNRILAEEVKNRENEKYNEDDNE